MRRGSPGMRGVTPFVDLLFLLLFGMLALSDSKKATSAEIVRVRLPAVEPGDEEGAGETKKIVLVVDADSEVRLEGRSDPIDGPPALDVALADLVGNALPDQFTVEIRGDAEADHGVMVALLQHLRRAGFAGVNLLALAAEDATWGKR
ncbi:MAG: biopolymer transporter ExbD [Planctomycetota bacterium]